MVESINGTGFPKNITNISKAQAPQKSVLSEGLSKTQQQLADQVSLSEDSQKALESLRNLDKQLTRFLDVLKGKRPASDVIKEINAENNGFIAGSGQNTTLNATQITAIQETTSLATEINDRGELDLILTQTRDTLSHSSFSLSSDQYNFFASAT